MVVTGMGLVTPLGIGREASWKQLLNGTASARTLTSADAEDMDKLAVLLKREPIGAPVDYDKIRSRLKNQCPEHAGLFSDELNALTLHAVYEAAADADLPLPLKNPLRTGCVIGTSKPSLRAMERQSRSLRDAVADGLSRHFQTAFQPDSPLRAAMAVSGASGPCCCPVAACATGLISVLQAASYVQSGLCDVCLAGSSDAALRSSVIASFHRLGVLSKCDNAAGACRPFDCDRDGFVIGEGAGVFVLESRRHAERRGARIYAQITNGCVLNDPTGLTQIATDGAAVAAVLKQLQTHQTIDYVNLHGTGTIPNDLAEANGLRRAFDTVPSCSASKGATGHLLGAAGSVELAFTVLALRDQVVPPTTNLLTPDRCAQMLPLAAASPIPKSLTAAAKLSLGFGGHVAGCVIRKG